MVGTPNSQHHTVEEGFSGGGAGSNTTLVTVEEVFMEISSRRAGLIMALTSDVWKLYDQCDPDKDNLCLYGLPNSKWEVKPPSKDIPRDLPEPVLGINSASKGMILKDWVHLIALHSAAWLIAVAFYFSGQFQFGKSERARLFEEINNLPTITEIVSDMTNDLPTIGDAKLPKDHQSPNHNSNKRKFISVSQSSESGAGTETLNMSSLVLINNASR